MKRNVVTILVLFITAFAVMAFVTAQNQKIVVPSEYKTKVNPFKGDASLNMVGLRTYNRHCVSCHGKKGLGDGVMSKTLKTLPGNFTTAEFQKYTDGEIYYLSFIGVSERPDFTKLIPTEEDRWAVVNYVRTLKIE
jgi:mono/diheme cytochrome c family protein